MFKSLRDNLCFLLMSKESKVKIVEAMQVHSHVTRLQDVVNNKFNDALKSQEELGESEFPYHHNPNGRILQ